MLLNLSYLRWCYMIKDNIRQVLMQSLETLNFVVDGTLLIEKPKHDSHGDFSTNVSFMLTKTLKKSPKYIAELLCDTFNKEVKGSFRFEPLNGFINIYVSDTWLWDHFVNMAQKPNFDVGDKKILLEYVSANPTGPLHIGHGRWAVLGSALSNLLGYVGYTVLSEFYVNDAGNQVTLFNESVKAMKEGISIPENGYHGSYIYDLAQQDTDPVKQNMDGQKSILKRVGVDFDCWFSEKTLHDSGEIEQALTSLKNKGFTYISDAALWFKSTEFGDEKDRVLVKADGTYTYFASDIAYHYNKIRRGFNSLINIWGADHHGYVARVKAAVRALLGDQYEVVFTIMIGQLVSLMREGEPVRMSKRTGEMISFEEVIDEIGVDATRYFLVDKSPDTHVEFDLDLAKKKSSENPVFYIQYAHARICSVFRKIKLESCAVNLVQLDEKERTLVKHCILFYDDIYEASQQLAPYKVAAYAFNLARCFHHFYEVCPILKGDKEMQAQRLTVLKHVQFVLVECLGILGLSAPESM